MLNAIYPAKLLLFGEYIIIRGAAALAIPFPHFRGQWELSEDKEKNQISLNDLRDFGNYLKRDPDRFFAFDFKAFQKALKQGWYFASDIPTGYGLGSSGAVCAAVYDHFFAKNIDDTSQSGRQALKQLLGSMESYFHGSSSGIDPLICYLRQAILFRQQLLESVTIPTLTKLRFFLVDTGQSRSTEPLVKAFMNNCEDKRYAKALDQKLLPNNEAAIQALLGGEEQLLWETFKEISAFQAEHFSEMIPQKLEQIWKQGISGGVFSLKLCGAGGGGFMLGLTEDWTATKSILQEWPLINVA